MTQQGDYTDLVHITREDLCRDRLGTLEKLRKEEGTMIELAKTMFEDPVKLKAQIERIKGRSKKIEELFATNLDDSRTWKKIRNCRYDRHSKRWLIKLAAEVASADSYNKRTTRRMVEEGRSVLKTNADAEMDVLARRKNALTAVYDLKVAARKAMMAERAVSAKPRNTVAKLMAAAQVSAKPRNTVAKLMAAAQEATRTAKAVIQSFPKKVLKSVATVESPVPLDEASVMSLPTPSDVTMHAINVKPVVTLSSGEIMELGLFDAESMDWDTAEGGSSQTGLELDVVDGSFSQVGAEPDLGQELEMLLKENLEGEEEGV